MAAEFPDWDAPLEAVDWNAVHCEPFCRNFLQESGSSDIQNGNMCGRGDTANGGTVEQHTLEDVYVEDDAGGSVPAPIRSFEELSMLPAYAMQGLRDNGIVSPMPIQSQALPLVLSGRDVIGLAQTGSGKTLAFLLPAVVHIEAQRPLTRWASPATPIALVLAPTRELAVQIRDEASKVFRSSRDGNHRNGVWAVVVYGGGNKREQVKELSWGPHILVATPGRLIDFIRSKIVSLAERVTYFVLDEADRMLDLGFQGDVASISGQVRPDRQVLFFSATWSSSVQELARGLCREGSRPVRIKVGQNRGCNGDVAGDDEANSAIHQARESILQEVIVVDFPKDWERQVAEKRKLLDKYLEEVLAQSSEYKVLVFVSQKVLADDLCSRLWEGGFEAGAMHGGKAQESRLYTLDRFRKGELRVLVATDVLGRGIDIPSVSHVVIFDMGTVEDYIHRIGRTARGKHGKGCALVFFEYYYKEPQIASELISVLEASKQPVPQGLRTIADGVKRGKRDTFDHRANWGKGLKVKGDDDEGVGLEGTWDRHLELEICPPETNGHLPRKSSRQGWNGRETSSDWQKANSRSGQQPHSWTNEGGSDRGKHNGYSSLPLSTEVSEWLEAVDQSGKLKQFVPVLQERGLINLDEVVNQYFQDRNFAAERFFKDVGVSKFGHKNHFRQWFRHYVVGGSGG